MIQEKVKDNSTLRLYLEEKRVIVDKHLSLLNICRDKFDLLGSPERYPSILYQSMHYSLSAGGKRIRPILSIAASEAVGGSLEDVIPVAVAIEMIHTYSLIHDDLPAMDNDDFRRGKLTNHKVFGEATAILAGDALLTLAFTILADYVIPAEAGIQTAGKGLDSHWSLPHTGIRGGNDGHLGVLSGEPSCPSRGTKEHDNTPSLPLPPRGGGEGRGGFPDERIGSVNILRIIHEIALGAGPVGMVGGQQLDIESVGKNINIKTLEEMHTRKTGALILAAVRAGGIAGGATDGQLRALTWYGTKIGLAFQIADDLLDVEGSIEEVGKSTGKDAMQHKNTYPALLGLEESKIVAQRLVDEAIAALEKFDERADPLRMIAEYIVERKS